MTIHQGLYGLPEPALPPRPPSRWRWLKYTIAYAVAAVFISLMVLHFMGGNGDYLKGVVEDYISETTGYTAKIGTLNAVSLYPVIGVDFDDLELTRDGKSVAKMDHFNFSTGFWGASMGSSVRTLSILNLSADAGVFTPGALSVDKLAIDVKQDAPHLILDGLYAGKPLSFTMPLRMKTGFSGSVSFGFNDKAPFHFRAGPVSADGFVSAAHGGRRLDVDNLVVAGNDRPISAAIALTLPRHGFGLDGKIQTGSTNIDYDLVFSSRDKTTQTIRGSIDADQFDPGDVFGAGGLIEAYDIAESFFKAAGKQQDSGFDFKDMDVSIDGKIDHLVQGGVDLGTLNTVINISENVLSLDSLGGVVKGGEVSGLVRLDTTKEPAALDANLLIKNMDYTAFSTMVESKKDKKGLAEFKVDLKASGRNEKQLMRALNGKATIIAGPGELTSSLVNLWGGGLLNTMIPKFDKGSDHLNLNCGIGDFLIDKGQATAKTLFFDTDSVTVVGDGKIDLVKSTISMKLEPKSKGAAFLSAATAVRVSGPLSKPEIAPDVFSLGKKLGSIFLGTINPVYLAFSLTDLGVSDSHPCKAYMKP